MTGRELRERHEAYERASGTEAAWDLLAGSIEADLCERAATVTKSDGTVDLRAFRLARRDSDGGPAA